jgi:hypothetical protein
VTPDGLADLFKTELAEAVRIIRDDKILAAVQGLAGTGTDPGKPKAPGVKAPAVPEVKTPRPGFWWPDETPPVTPEVTP